MSDAPTGLSSTKATIVTKSPSPAAGSLGNKGILSLTGEAYSQPDPMRGRIVQEGSPQAITMQADLDRQIKDAKIKKNGTLPSNSTKSNWLEPGKRVYHTARHEYGIVAKRTEDKKRVEVIFPGGRKALVRIINLQKV